MTLERDLDRRLAAWLDERAVAAPPADLLARSLVRVDATGQRGAWRFPSAVFRGPVAAGRPVLPAWAILVLVALVAVALVVAGSEIVRHYLGYSDDEAAAAMSVPTGTVKSRLNRAKAALRSALEADARGSGLAMESVR